MDANLVRMGSNFNIKITKMFDVLMFILLYLHFFNFVHVKVMETECLMLENLVSDKLIRGLIFNREEVHSWHLQC